MGTRKTAPLDGTGDGLGESDGEGEVESDVGALLESVSVGELDEVTDDGGGGGGVVTAGGGATACDVVRSGWVGVDGTAEGLGDEEVVFVAVALADEAAAADDDCAATACSTPLLDSTGG